MSFFLDYVHVGDFKQPGGDRDEFDVLLFSQTRLAPGPHTLSVTVNPNSVALLDYLIFECVSLPGFTTLRNLTVGD